MNFQRAFKVLANLIDSSVNFHSYSAEQRDRFHTMAYWFKQVIEYSADYGTQYPYTKDCIKRFTEEVNMFNKKFDRQYPYILRMQELLDEVRVGEIIQEEKLAAWKPFLLHLTLMKGWIIKTIGNEERVVATTSSYGDMTIHLTNGTEISIDLIEEYRVPQVKASERAVAIV